MTTRTSTVTGMTCGHCVTAVSAKISKLAGVTGVAAAVEETGYQLTGIGTDTGRVR